MYFENFLDVIALCSLMLFVQTSYHFLEDYGHQFLTFFIEGNFHNLVLPTALLWTSNKAYFLKCNNNFGEIDLQP